MELNNNTYCILWEPPENIQNFVFSKKNKVRTIAPNSSYLNHLVHSTLYVFNSAKDSSEIIEKINNSIKNIQIFNINIYNWKVFYNDLITKSDTLVLEIEINKKLLNIQNKIVKSLNSIRSNNIYYNNTWEGEYLKSYNNWGFPFVGNHWIPHITIASLSNQNKFINNTIQEDINFPSLEFNSISLHLVKNNEHIKIKNFTLKS